MAEDIRMNNFVTVADASYAYIEQVDGGQGKISTTKLMENGGIFKFYSNIKAGSSIELPFKGGLIIVQNASVVHGKACAIIDSSGTGSILVAQNYINFFSEVSNKINIYNTGIGTKYIVKNSLNIDSVVSVIFIG